jgi:hypothetical protein
VFLGKSRSISKIVLCRENGRVDKYFIDKKGRAEGYVEGGEDPKTVHFPLCLAVKYGGNVPMDCSDFLLNTSRGELFISSDAPFPVGSKLTLHFYIPPKTKLLGEFTARVVDVREVNEVRGSFIKISDFFHMKLHKLEQYLEEDRHLVDEKA